MTDVMKDSPAAKAGFKRGDLIVEFMGRPVKDEINLRNMVANTPPGTVAEVKVIRKGKKMTLTVTLGEFPETLEASRGEYGNLLRGVYVQELTPELRSTLDIPEKVSGVIVTNVEEDSPAAGVLRRNDVIQEINQKVIKGLKDYEKVVSEIKPDEGVLLLIYRAGGYIYVTIKP